MKHIRAYIYYSITLFLCTSAVSVPCPHGTFGEECHRQCHCLSGPAFCRSLDGKCTDNRCSFGWTNPPHCQTECPAGLFGLDCSLLCHCQDNDRCSNVNGLCKSGVCGYGWGGASCQRALPVMYEPPTVSRVNGDQLIIRWLQWIPGLTGNGSGPVVGYTLQALTQFPNDNWQDLHVLPRIGSLLSEVETRLTLKEDGIQVKIHGGQVAPSVRPVVNSLDQTAASNSESPITPRLFSFVTANLLPNTAYKFRVVLIGLYLEKPESSWPGPATPLWTTTACGFPTDPPTDVQISVTNESFISVLWKPPAMETVRCHGIARHDVSLTFSEPSCRDVIVPVLWPVKSALLAQCSSISSVAVRVVGDSGNRGPWSSEFLLHSDLSLREKVITSYEQLVTWTSLTTPHSITSNLSQVTDPVHLASSQELRTTVPQTVEQVIQNQSTPAMTVRQTVQQMIQNQSTFGMTVRHSVEQLMQNKSTSGTTVRHSVERVIQNQSTFGTTVRHSAEQLMQNKSTSGTTVRHSVEKGIQNHSTTPTITDGHESVISELLKDACMIEILKRNEHSLMVKLSAVNQQVSFESCCLWNIKEVNESRSELDEARVRPGVFTKMFNHQLRASTFYQVTVTAQLIVSSLSFAHTFSLILSTGPRFPDQPLPPNVTDIGYGRLRVELSPVTKRREGRSLSSVESRLMVIIERNASLVGPSDLEKMLVKGLGKSFDMRSVDRAPDILMNATSALFTNSQHYVAGLVSTDARQFVIGEETGLNQLLYSNPTIEQGHYYLVWLAVENTVDGLSHRAYSRAVKPIFVSDHGSAVSWWIWIIVLFVIFLIGIAATVTVVVFARRKSCCKSDSELLDELSRNRPSGGCQMSFPPAVINDATSCQLEARLSKRIKSATFSMLSSPPTQLVSEYSFTEPRLVYESNYSTKSPVRTNAIVIGDLRSYCEHYLWIDSNQVLSEEFVCLPKGFTNTVSIATRPINSALNRTAGSVPYDQNRIRSSSGDYINASLVRTIGWRKFIVTQCPMSATVSKFWKVVWEQNVTRIVALIQPGEVGNELYWPEKIDRVSQYDDIQVEVVSVVELAHYVIREFIIKPVDVSREYGRSVVQWQYTWWPSNKDLDTASSSHPVDFLNFVKLTRNSVDHSQRQSVSSLTLVHCVTGGGRSGLFLSVDALIDQGRHTGLVDVLKCVSLLRTERSSLVRSLRQYRFIYECLCEEFDHPQSRYSIERFLSICPYGPVLDVEYSLVFAPLHFASARCNHNTAGRLKSCSSTRNSSLRRKIGFGRHHGKDEGDCNEFDEDSHPAIIADGFIDRHSFIVYQCPNSFEADSFWDVVVDNRIMCMVVLCSIATDIPNSHLIIPGLEGEMTTASRYSIKNHAVYTHSDESFITYSLSVTTRHGGDVIDQRTVHVFELRSWSSSTAVPRAGTLVQLVEQVRGWRQHHCPSRPILVFGAAESCVGRKDRSRSAVFCTLWTLIEQAERTGFVDIFASTRLMCSQLPSAIISKEHYILLYEAVIKHLTVHRSVTNVEQLNDVSVDQSAFQYSCLGNRDRLIKNISNNQNND